jgi:hypothetical protein
MRVSVSQFRVISQRYSKESQSSSPVGEPRVYRTGVMGSRDPSQSVGPSNTSPLAVPEAELISVKPAAGLRAHLTEEEGVRSEACRDTRSDS